MAPATATSRSDAGWLLARGLATVATLSGAVIAVLMMQRRVKERRRRDTDEAQEDGACCGDGGGACGCQHDPPPGKDAPGDSCDPEDDLEDMVFDGLNDTGRSAWGEESVKRPARLNGKASFEAIGSGTWSANSAPELPGKQRIFVKTYGCAHNSSDSEFMAGQLRDYGYTLVDKLENADACVINSCTVKNPSQDTALTLTRKAREAGKPVVLAGCVPSADSTVTAGMDGVSLLGVTQLDRVVDVVEEAIRGNVVKLLGHKKALPSLELPKVRRNSCVEIIPISGGCLGNCSYCKTKHARGKLSSYTEEAIVNRALQAASEGVSEVWLTSEDTGAYGIDLGTNIAALLNRVADALPSGVMLKLGMTNPPYMLAHLDAVAEVLRRPNVFEFIHIPVQSGSDRVLHGMIREYTSDDFKRLANGLREKVPGMLVATDIICGFPTEAEEDHQQSLELVKEFKFSVLNISQFYPRPGTAAAKMKKIPSNVVKRRSQEMTMLFDSYETFTHLVGCEERVWFCESDSKHGQTVGHTKRYAKVVVPRDDALLGTSAMVRFRVATKWHVEGELTGKK